MHKAIELENAIVYVGNNLDVLPALEDNSVDSIVTDPPYELGFMGKKWDSSGIAYSTELWKECLRVLKPGGHLLSFGGTRTWHRVAVAIEDSGFEVRDSIAWMYGSGFPKSLDVSKAIDKAAGAERKVIGYNEKVNVYSERHAFGESQVGESYAKSPITAATTPEAQQWEGWGTALKPAFEPIVVARKPLIGTVAQNVLTHGTGGLNIDGSRIGTNKPKAKNAAFNSWKSLEGRTDRQEPEQTYDANKGRWPANVILDPYTAELLDEQSGLSKSKATAMKAGLVEGIGSKNLSQKASDYASVRGHDDSGGASRFFYVAKASKRDRNEGLEELEGRLVGTYAQDEWSRQNMGNTPDVERKPVANFHPTVKPTALMEYLINLVTPPNGTVLDPFTGSGSTGKAALFNDFRFIGIEMTEEYLPIIEGRLKYAIQNKKNGGLF
jgi:DNA modification methylase